MPFVRLAVEQRVAPDLAAQVLEQLRAPVEALQVDATRVRLPETGATLTTREIEILRLIASGANNPEIATQLVISVHTVKSHVAHILDKLAVASRTEAAIRARELGLL